MKKMELVAELLSEAIKGESFAEKLYEAFAHHAAKEGLSGIARLFSGLARAEAVHIANHKRALIKNNGQTPYIDIPETLDIGSVTDNIATAIAGEAEEVNSMYPSFIKQIKKEHGTEFEAKVAILSLSWALEAEKVHLSLLQQAQKSMAQGKDLDEEHFYLCGVCGNIVYSEIKPESICPICGHDAHFYNKVPR